MKKWIGILLSLVLMVNAMVSLAEQSTPAPVDDGFSGTQQGTPPQLPPDGMNGQQPDGQNQGGQMSDGQPPEKPGDMPGGMPDGQPPEKPDGMPGDMPGDMPVGMGGMSQAPTEYAAVYTYSEDADLTEADLVSIARDESALLVCGGIVSLTNSVVSRQSSDSTGGDSASFYGVGAALLATDGELNIESTVISTDAAGGAGVFAYGNGVVNVKDCVIETLQNTSGGIHVAGGGTLHAENLNVTTWGESAAAIRSDRGGGEMTVSGGSYTSHGTGSPAVYVTASISIENAILTATGSEALCLEGKNDVSLTDCVLTGSMADLDQNDNTWTVILYQSMSGDSQVGKGSFTMTGGQLVSQNGGIFYTTNTGSEFTIDHVDIVATDDCEYLLRCTGNSNQRIWGQAGQNGANCLFTAISQAMDGDVLWDSISNLTLRLTQGTVLTGSVLQDESCAGQGGSGSCAMMIDANSTWVVRGNSQLTRLENAGSIIDEAGRAVTISSPDGTIYAQGDSEWIVTVSQYEETGR